MAANSSPFAGAPAETSNEDDPASASDTQFYNYDDSNSSALPGHPQDVASGHGHLSDSKSKEPHPMQKRRRVTRACDECRRKKIKCDGKQPCTHCTVYSYECTYDQPSNRRRNPAPQYVEALENRLHKAEALLRVVLPDLNLDDPQFDVHATEQMLAAIKKEKPQPPMPTASAPKTSTAPEPTTDAADGGAGDESLLESMVENSGCLDLDDQGHWDYHGHTSGIIFLQRLRKQLGASDMPVPSFRTRVLSQMLDSPKSTSESPSDSSLPPTHDLPPGMLHSPSFFAMLDRIYDTPPEQFGNEENSFLPLLYIVISVGCLFSDDGAGTLDIAGYEGAIGQGFQYFKAGRQLLDITDCRDLTSLQAVCFMVLFLQSSAKLSTCYSYVGIALRSALRLGLHRSVAADFNPIERELRKRIFWVVRKMDVYVSTLLGLPQMLSNDDIDQEYPMDVDGQFITKDGILPMPSDYTPLMAGANAHTRLSNIILKVVKYIYPVKNALHPSKSDMRYMVSHSKIREIERDLQTWMEELPAALRPGTEVSPQLERIRQLLRISYAHVQVVMYRPFLHYVSSGSQARGVDRRSYACAAACVSVSRNIVHITTGMHKRGLLNGSFWFTMYTTYFAILSLIFFVLENPDSPTAKDGVLKDAMEGKNTLAGLAKKSLAADRCSQSLNSLFKNLPELLKNRQSSVKPVNLKRPAPAAVSRPAANVKSQQSAPEIAPPQRASTFPLQLLSRQSKAEASNTPKSLDDSHNFGSGKMLYQSQVNTQVSTPTWPPSTPEPRTDTTTTTTPEPLIADQARATTTASPMPGMHSREPSSGQFSAQQLANTGNLPDLMPIMFPSDDPFAYPTQPMSTLEDDHFRVDGLGLQSANQFGFDPSSQGLPSNDSPMGAVSTPTFDNFGTFPLFNNGTSTGINATLPHRVAPQKQQAMNQARLQSPVSHSSTPGSGTEAVNSPDLVSIPNQNFMWQGYNFQPQTFPQDSSGPQQVPTTTESQGFSMGINENNEMGAGLDMGFLPLDDIFGDPCRPNTLANDDWIQWMNVGS
ncbi:putative C6 transcription factor (Mut3) [Aspergillus novofumigatus IBT 16806]|uniref:Putative C6 transcription factor n=1 Tax=Aspergillus novofumigatus (strain IBT 16806) TaxID=1392255 RepID=A0A2I1C3K9_ASPN1|nr:putative C6 transcription factor [Aspergillus novofumigatus IBT 16806]PKX92219.1 putative C6 transcription factor [Aspergillus novofumigatus IBT 16806]